MEAHANQVGVLSSSDIADAIKGKNKYFFLTVYLILSVGLKNPVCEGYKVTFNVYFLSDILFVFYQFT